MLDAIYPAISFACDSFQGIFYLTACAEIHKCSNLLPYLADFCIAMMALSNVYNVALNKRCWKHSRKQNRNKVIIYNIMARHSSRETTIISCYSRFSHGDGTRNICHTQPISSQGV